MKRISLVVLLTVSLASLTWGGEISSLSEVFLLGKGLLDRDHDNHADTIALKIVIPNSPTAHEIAVASDIAARANLESLVVDFTLTVRESAFEVPGKNTNAILIGSNLQRVKKLAEAGKIKLSELKTHEGIVSLFSHKKDSGIVLAAGSQDALFQTGRAFFLRWPYLWDVWGREEGQTYFSLEKDLASFLSENEIEFKKITIQSARYEFPPLTSSFDAVKRLKFDRGEIKDLTCCIDFKDEAQREKAAQALESLIRQHRSGINTGVLSYTGCARITFELTSPTKASSTSLDRVGFPKRILTPAYKSPLRLKIPEKNFDLLGFFSPKAAYSDTNQDKIPDKINSIIVMDQQAAVPAISQLTSRLVLPTAGASFPLVYLDSEIENPKTLDSAILVGRENTLIQELIHTAKLKIPPLGKNQGVVQVIPNAFNSSNAVAIVGADALGLDKTIAYLSQTFPFLNEFEDGNVEMTDIASAVEEYLAGRRGSAEAYFYSQLKNILKKIKDKKLDFFRVKLFVPSVIDSFNQHVKTHLSQTLQADKIEVNSLSLDEGKSIFEKEKEFTWEGDEALKIIHETLAGLEANGQPLSIYLGVSESPAVREKIADQVRNLISQNGFITNQVEIDSAYKQGFFWLTEKIIPLIKSENAHHLSIKFGKEKDDFTLPKRFYTEPSRWLQELYPADEIIARETGIPIERISFEMKETQNPTYEIMAFDEDEELLIHETFSPRTRETDYMRVLPEWGKVKLTTGWVRVNKGGESILDVSLQSDLERFWEFYQDEVLVELYDFILKKTDNEPCFKKQPYFKRLLIEMWFSEPDYKLGLEEEIISSLEAMHDELYFDTLDLLRGITEIDVEDEDMPEDSSRYSAPGNVLPLIHPSQEGQGGRVKVSLTDWQGRIPRMELEWKEAGKKEKKQKISFPSLKTKSLRIPAFIYGGIEDRLESLTTEIEFEKEKEYKTLIDILSAYQELRSKAILQTAMNFPRLRTINLRIRHKQLTKEEFLAVEYQPLHVVGSNVSQFREGDIVPTDQIISPEMCQTIVNRLSEFKNIKSYSAGRSYEKRQIPVVEVFSPLNRYVSLPRLLCIKPTLYLSGRQHANEVSATNCILKLAELLAKDDEFKSYTKKINFVLHPMENPDGAELAYKLQKITPFHSLHAGRYSSLGMDIGYQVNAAKPLLPEAKVRKNLYDKWLPDIYLNLHGYPSHEWVQQFSNYSPYLFRDYWIPRGWFAYYRALSLSIYEKWKEAGEELKSRISQELNSHPKIRASNKLFYNRYFRWASRWQPHISYLEIHDGTNIYAKRKSSKESKLSERRKITFVEETPEVMDETAQGQWLDFLCEQGLAYLKAHADYLWESEFITERLEEESRDRIHIQFIRTRPGKTRD